MVGPVAPVPSGPAGAILRCVERMAADLARLRRRDLGPSYWIGERLAAEVEVIDAVLWPTAGDLVRHGVDVERALAVVEGRQAWLWHAMGGRPRV